MLEFIKEIHRKRLMRNLQAAPREKKILNIDQVKTIGVICRLDDEANWNILYHFARVMENQGKQVDIIALLQKDQEIGFVITHRDTHIVRAKTDTNFWGLPSSDSVRPFVEKTFDLLIDTIGADDFFSQYIALSTTAALKVAFATRDEEPSDTFDFTIRGDKPVDLKDYFNPVIEYLSMIQK